MKRPDAKRIRQLFRYLKFHQLMYRVSGPQQPPSPSTVRCPVAAKHPMGLLAVFFPAVLLQTGAWTLTAEVEWGQKRSRKQPPVAYAWAEEPLPRHRHLEEQRRAVVCRARKA